jgi:RNA polymerase sigma-70 factor (ECF subfamily)
MNRIEKIRSGDLAELDKVYIEIKPRFINYAKKQFPHIQLEDIEDIYQDTIIVFYNNIRRGLLVEINSSLSAYIIQIGKIKLIQFTEKQENARSIRTNFVDNEITEDEYDQRIDQAVKFIFSKMSDACKQILNLFYYEKKSMEEIALILSYKNADTVKSKKRRCISQFSSNLNNLTVDHEER